MSVEALFGHRRMAHHRDKALHPCRCPYEECREEFPTWRLRLQHVKEIHEQKDGESRTKEGERPAPQDVSNLLRSVYVSQAEGRTPPRRSPPSASDRVDQTYERAIQGLVLKTYPRARCETCREWFATKGALKMHRVATGHFTLLMEHSRYIKLKLQCQPVD